MTNPRSLLRSATRLAAAVLAVGCRLAGAATTDVGEESHDLQFSGFGTVGIVHGKASPGQGYQRDFAERSNDGGLRADIDTRLGLQANYRASSDFEFVGQVLGANRAARAPASDAITLALVAWRPRDDVTLRVGRLSTDYFLLANYRNVGFAYPFVRPPTESYASVPYALDGADLTKAWNIDDAVWKVRGVVGASRATAEVVSQSYAFRPTYSFGVSREDSSGLRVKASVSRAWVRVDDTAAQPLLAALRSLAALPAPEVAAQAADLERAIAVNGTAATYLAFGAALDRNAWLADFEMARFVSPGRGFTTAWGILGHRWGPVTAFGGLSAIRTPRGSGPPQWTAALTPLLGAAGAARAQQIGLVAAAAVASTNATQRTLTLGLRWDVGDRTALKLQWDRLHVDPYASRLWSGPPAADGIRANVFSATVDFVF